jgi:hypothetical protein
MVQPLAATARQLRPCTTARTHTEKRSVHSGRGMHANVRTPQTGTHTHTQTHTHTHTHTHTVRAPSTAAGRGVLEVVHQRRGCAAEQRRQQQEGPWLPHGLRLVRRVAPGQEARWLLLLLLRVLLRLLGLMQSGLLLLLLHVACVARRDARVVPQELCAAAGRSTRDATRRELVCGGWSHGGAARAPAARTPATPACRAAAARLAPGSRPCH